MFYLHTIYIIKKKKPYGARLDCSIWFSTYLFKKEMACRLCRTRILDAFRLRGYRRKTASLAADR